MEKRIAILGEYILDEIMQREIIREIASEWKTLQQRPMLSTGLCRKEDFTEL